MQICRRISDTNNEIMALIFEMCYPCYPCIGVNLFKLSPLSGDLKRNNDANNGLKTFRGILCVEFSSIA